MLCVAAGHQEKGHVVSLNLLSQIKTTLKGDMQTSYTLPLK